MNDGIAKTGAGNVSLTGPITLGGDQTWTNNSAGALSTGSGTNLITNGGFDLTVGGTGTTTFGTINNAAVTLSGSGDLIKNDSGRLNIGGLNSGFSGAVTVNGGVLHAYNDAGALGNGNVTLNGGVLSFYWGLTYTRTLGTGTSQVQILGGESGFAGSGTTGPSISLGTSVTWGSTYFKPDKFVLGDAGTANVAVTTFSSGIVLDGGTRTIVVPKGTSGAGNRSTISGAISNGTGTSNLVKEGDGWLFLTAAPTYNGTTTVSGGLLDLASVSLASMGGGTGVRSITVAAGAAVRRNTLDNAFLQRLVENSNEIGVMTGTTVNNLDFSSSAGANLPNAFLGNWASNGAKAEHSGTITPGSSGYKLGAKGSAGLLGIVGTNKLTGSSGLTVGQTGGSGIRVEIAGATDFTGDTVITTGAKLTIGHNLALQNSALNLGAAGGTFAVHATFAAGHITGATASPSPTFGGLIGSRSLTSAFTATGGNNETLLANTAVTGFTLNVGTGLTHTYSGAIGGFGTGASGGLNGNSTLNKTGLGTQILTGVSTYSGATTITGGTLAINSAGSINASNVTINHLTATFRYNSSVAYNKTLTFTSGTLAGTNWTGTLAGQTIGTNQTISPGNSPGTATTGAQTWAAGGSYLWEINNAQVGGIGGGTAGLDPGWDLENGTGTLDITATSGSKFNLLITSLTALNAAGNATNFLDANSYTWLIADFNLITGYAANAFNINTTNFLNTFTGTFGTSLGGVGLVPGDNTQIYLTYTPVPETSAALLGGLGLLALLRRRRA